ncbi:hypothetical protein D3C78_1491150 [compost metagenome]
MIVLIIGIFANVGAIIANQVVKYRPDRLHMVIQRQQQGRPVVEPHAPGQPRLVEFILRQRLRLLIGNRLQQVFQPAQEQVTGTHRLYLLRLQQPQFPHRL